MSTYEIIKNMPMPRKHERYNFSAMEVGDGFVLASSDAARVRCAASAYTKRDNPDWEFSVRRIDDTTHGCWRVK